MIDQAFILALTVLAAAVAIRQARRRNAWPLVVAYWVTLTAKNLYSFLYSFLFSG